MGGYMCVSVAPQVLLVLKVEEALHCGLYVDKSRPTSRSWTL